MTEEKRGPDRGDYKSRQFRLSRRLSVPYEKQGYIYFCCLNYEEVTGQQRRRIDSLCKSVGGEHRRALFEYLTSGSGAQKIADKHYISPATLYRLRQKFFESW